MNRFIKYLSLIAGVAMVVSLASCVKNRNDLNTDFSGLKPLVELRTPPANVAGLLNFSKASLNFASDTTTLSFYVNLASVEAMNKDLTVNVSVDNAAITNYNATSAIQYEVFPDSTFSLPQTTVTIPAGQHVALVTVSFYGVKVDPTKSYMLPISITDAQGINVSANFSTIYYHFIGNPLAGAYLWDYTRWNTSTYSGTPNGSSFTGGAAVFSAVNPTTLSIQSGYGETVGFNCHYILTFTNTGGVLSNFAVTIDPDEPGGLTAQSIALVDGPNLLLADPVTKHFKFSFGVVNSTPAPRTFNDEFYLP